MQLDVLIYMLKCSFLEKSCVRKGTWVLIKYATSLNFLPRYTAIQPSRLSMHQHMFVKFSLACSLIQYNQ